MIILASKSLARAQLVLSAGLTVDLMDSQVDESLVKAELLARKATPKDVAQHLAATKALAIKAPAESYVIGADQTLDLRGQLFDKVSTLDEARDRLAILSGKTHYLHSGLTIARGGDIKLQITQSAALTVRELSSDFIDHYISSAGPDILSSVGCYQLESIGVQLFEKIEGDYFTILGLPMLALLEFLRSEGQIP
jgi:septum formation protein